MGWCQGLLWNQGVLAYSCIGAAELLDAVFISKSKRDLVLNLPFEASSALFSGFGKKMEKAPFS